MKAVFLDRDGTLIELVHHLTDPGEVRLIPGAGGAVRDLRAAGYRVVIVTNQSVVGRGMLTEAGLAEVHAEMARQLAAEGAAVDAVYFCPLAPVQKDPTVIEHPMRKPPWVGFGATATIKRSDFGLSYGVPAVGDEVKIQIALEGGLKAE